MAIATTRARKSGGGDSCKPCKYDITEDLSFEIPINREFQWFLFLKKAIKFIQNSSLYCDPASTANYFATIFCVRKFSCKKFCGTIKFFVQPWKVHCCNMFSKKGRLLHKIHCSKYILTFRVSLINLNQLITQ